MKNDIFSKINKNDYNNQLEEILEKKDFSKDVKNLLLSMLYKVEMSYSDYVTVKRNVKNKSEFIYDILEKIKSCEHIILIKPQSQESEELEKKHSSFIIEEDKKTIKVYPNEKSILYAINAFNNTRIYIPEKYDYLRIAFPNLINDGRAINNIEIIRDFNAWSWNISLDEIGNIKCNLIYQILQIMIGEKNLENLYINKKNNDYLTSLEDELKQLYSKNIVDKFLKLMYEISILLCVNDNSIEKKRLIEEKQTIQNELNYMEDKKKYLLDLTNEKKRVNKQIKQIDKMLNDKKKLEEEFEKRNLELFDESKIFSLFQLSKILIKERKRNLNKIEDINNYLEPKNYIKYKQKKERDFEILKDIEKNGAIEEKVNKLQKIFIKCFEEQIIQAEEKKEIINLVYLFRYYMWIPYDEKNKIKEVKELKKYCDEVKEILIKKMYELKVINKISSDIELNIEIFKFLFETKMIVLENIVFEIEKQEEKIQVNIMDIDAIEEKFYLSNKKVEGKKIKYNKKIKLFN